MPSLEPGPGVDRQAPGSGLTPRLLQRVERGANVFIRRPLPEVRLDHGPLDASRAVDDVDGRVRDCLELLAVVRRIANAVRVDGPVVRIREKQVVDRGAPVRRDLLRERRALGGRVDADGEEPDGLTRLQ